MSLCLHGSPQEPLIVLLAITTVRGPAVCPPCGWPTPWPWHTARALGSIGGPSPQLTVMRHLFIVSRAASWPRAREDEGDSPAGISPKSELSAYEPPGLKKCFN